MNLDGPIYGIPAHIENWATVLAALGAVGSLVFCVRHAVVHRSPLPLYLFAGGALTCFIEPFIDTLGHAIFAQEDRISWTSSFGRHIPAYIGLTLMFYVAPAYVWLLTTIEKGVTRREWGTLCAVLVTTTFVFEFVPLHYDLWQYYGPQGLQVGEAPLWWGFTNAHGLIGTAVLLHLLLKVIPRDRLVVLVPLMPALFLGVHTAGSTFGYLGLNSTTSKTAAYAGTVATCLLCSVFFWLYSKVVCRPVAEETAAAPARSSVLTQAP